MKISILTLFPEMFSGFLNESIVKRAQESGHVEIQITNIRDFTTDSRKTVDDRPYGGGAGMVMMAIPIIDAINNVKHETQNVKQKIILTSARGKVYSQKIAKGYSQLDHLIIIAGHYEGVDERVISYVDEEISIGDFILTGGELPAAIIIDSIVRLIPGVLKKEEATTEESFFNVSINRLIDTCGEDEVLTRLKKKGITSVNLLEYPQYTRPQEINGKKVPKVLLSGDHKKIREWQIKKAFFKTKTTRPDLLLIES